MSRIVILGIAVAGLFLGYATMMLWDQPRLAMAITVLLWVLLRQVEALQKKGNLTKRYRAFVTQGFVRRRLCFVSARAVMMTLATATYFGPRSSVTLALVLFVLAVLLVPQWLDSVYQSLFRVNVDARGLPEVDRIKRQWRWFDTTSEPFRQALGKGLRLLRHFEPLVFGAVAASGSIGISVATILAASIVGALVGAVQLLTVIRAVARKPREALSSTIISELVALQPEVVVYFSAPNAAQTQEIEQWIEPIASSGQSVFVLTREKKHLTPLARLAEPLPVVLAVGMRDLESVTPPSARLALYVNNAAKNSHFLKNTGLTHVQLLHGESDKASSYSKVSAAYDRLFVSGQIAIRRYSKHGISIPQERFAVVGRPTTDALSRDARADGDAIVLYAPTFEGFDEQNNYSSLLTHGSVVVRALLYGSPNVRLMVRPHPLSGTNQTAYKDAVEELKGLIAAANGVAGWERHTFVTAADASLNWCMDQSSALIADVSSVVVDYLATTKPVIVCDPFGLEASVFESRFPTTRGSYVIPPTNEAVVEAVTAALNDDPLRPQRELTRKAVLGSFDGPATDRFHAALETLLRSKEPDCPS